MPEAWVAGPAVGQPCLSAAQERAFERHARRFGHDVGRLCGGAELVSYPVVPSLAAMRALPAATSGQRRRRQQVFFNPVVEYVQPHSIRIRALIGYGLASIVVGHHTPIRFAARRVRHPSFTRRGAVETRRGS
jgi:hypothetical protein